MTWVKGQSGNPKGRAPRHTEKLYLDKTFENCTVDDWAEIVQKAVVDAKRGVPEARLWLGKYILGEPEMVHKHLLEERKEITVRVEFVGRELPPLADTVDGEVRALPAEIPAVVLDSALVRELAGEFEEDE